jgi:hypothetical protein
METNTNGWRVVPPGLLIGTLVSVVWSLIYAVIYLTSSFEHGFSPRLSLISSGINMAYLVMGLSAMLELATRSTGHVRTGLKVASVAFIIDLVAYVAWILVTFSSSIFTEHRWVFTANNYVNSLVAMLVPLGLAIAAPLGRGRMLGIVATIFAVLTTPIPPLQDTINSLLPKGQTAFSVYSVFGALRYVLVLLVVMTVARGPSTENRSLAAGGMRLAVRSLWLRVLAAAFLVLVTMVAASSRGTDGVSTMRLALVSQGIVGALSLGLLGWGALRGARANVLGLSTWTLSLAGGAALWACGVLTSQLPHLYRLLYGNDGRFEREITQHMAIAVPIAVIAAGGLFATAISGLGAQIGSDEMSSDAQGKGIGFVALMIVAVAIQTWLLPKSRTPGNFAALSVLSAAAAIYATVLIARVLARAADTLEEKPGLPPASIVNAGS